MRYFVNRRRVILKVKELLNKYGCRMNFRNDQLIQAHEAYHKNTKFLKLPEYPLTSFNVPFNVILY